MQTGDFAVNTSNLYRGAQCPLLQGRNARQLVDFHRGMFDVPILELPQPCSEDPPDACNCYSDGGVLYPTFSEYQLGGAGIVWP